MTKCIHSKVTKLRRSENIVFYSMQQWVYPSNMSFPSQFLRWYQVMPLGDRGACLWTTCPGSLPSSDVTGIWTHDLLTASPMPKPLRYQLASDHCVFAVTTRPQQMKVYSKSTKSCTTITSCTTSWHAKMLYSLLSNKSTTNPTSGVWAHLCNTRRRCWALTCAQTPLVGFVTDGQTELRWLRRAIAVPAVARKNWSWSIRLPLLHVPDGNTTLMVVQLFLKLIRRQMFSINQWHHLIITQTRRSFLSTNIYSLTPGLLWLHQSHIHVCENIKSFLSCNILMTALSLFP